MAHQELPFKQDYKHKNRTSYKAEGAFGNTLLTARIMNTLRMSYNAPVVLYNLSYNHNQLHHIVCS